MKVKVYNYRRGPDTFEAINDVEFDDALRMIHPDAAWMWDRDGHELTSGSVEEVVALWSENPVGNIGCVVNTNHDLTKGPFDTHFVFNGQRWQRGFFWIS